MVKHTFRWPVELKTALMVAAVANRRSLNAEIVVRLERDLARERQVAADERGAAA